MKFKIFFLFFSLICLAAEAESSDQKGGFYAGIQGGMTNLNTKYDITDYENSPPGRARYEGGTSFLTGGGMVGYHFSLKKFYVETELYALYQNAKLRIVTDGGWNILSISVKKQDVYGAAALMGIPLFDALSQTSAYLRLGVETGAYKFSIVNPHTPGFSFTNTDGNKSKQLSSFAPGIGLKTFLMENLFLRAEYTYVRARSVTLTTYTNSAGRASPITHKFTPTEQRFMLSVVYQF